MKYYFFILLFTISCTRYNSQINNCNLSIQYNSSEFAKNKNINYDFKNISGSKIRIPEKLNSRFITIEAMELLNVHSHNYDKIKFNIVDVDCFNKDCYGKMLILKPNNQKKYTVSLMNKFSFKEKGLYRLKVRLDLSFNPCNYFITDWIYYQAD